MAIDQKRIYELINQYLPDASDDFSSIYIAVDKNGFGSEAKKMPLSVLFSATTEHKESDITTFTGTSFSLVYTDEGGTAFNDSDYRLDLKVYKIDDIDGKSVKTSIPILDEAQTAVGFSFDLYKNYGVTIYVDYKAETR